MKTYRFVFPDGYQYVVKSNEGLRSAKESLLRDYGLWARRGRDPKKAIDLYWALDNHKGQYKFEECEDSAETKGKVKRKLSEETKRKLSAAKKGQVPWNKGIEWPEEKKKNLRGLKRSAATREKMSRAKKGKKPWNTGLRWGPEVKQKMRETQLNKWKWLTDGVHNKCVRMEAAVAYGWWRGRTKSTPFVEWW